MKAVWSIEDVLKRLCSARTFNQAADTTLQTMLAIVSVTVAESALADKAHVLRGRVHLRRARSYHRYSVVEVSPTQSVPTVDSTRGRSVAANCAVPAATAAWRWVEEQCRPIAIDVSTSTLLSYENESAQPTQIGVVPRLSADTKNRLLDRQATHVLVVPLLAYGGEVCGMVELEATCRSAIGEEFVWRLCQSTLVKVAQLSTPYLLLLPEQLVEQQTGDLLPVVGPVMIPVLRLLQRFAPFEETLLLSGPTGVGKSRLSRYCHSISGRAGHFVAVNLLGVPENLQASDLFGSVKGAFTDAEPRSGAIARAQKGTLFLDEIDKLSLSAQSTLLLFLDSKIYRNLGSDVERCADVRIIVGTNVDLRAAVAQGLFREDLYYRINVFPVSIPSLDDRGEKELLDWAHYMLQRKPNSRRDGRSAEPGAVLARAAADELCLRRWPGNLRQLDNVIRRAYVLSAAERRAGEDLVVDREHVRQALALEGEEPHGKPASSVPAQTPKQVLPDEPPLFEALMDLAGRFVSEVEVRVGKDPPLMGKHAQAFRELVLLSAVRRLGTQVGPSLLGFANRVGRGNQYRDIKKAEEAVRQLCAVLGIPVPNWLSEKR